MSAKAPRLSEAVYNQKYQQLCTKLGDLSYKRQMQEEKLMQLTTEIGQLVDSLKAITGTLDTVLGIEAQLVSSLAPKDIKKA